MVMNLHIKLHHLVNVEGAHPARDNHAHRIAQEVWRVILLEERRIARECGALVRLFNITFDCNRAVFTAFAEEVEHHLERVDIPPFRKRGAFYNTNESSANPLQDVHRVGGQHSTERRAADDKRIGLLDQDANFAIFHEVASKYTTKYDKDSNDRKHSLFHPVRRAFPP